MIRTQVYIPDDLHRDLMLLAKSEGVNFSTLIREGTRAIIHKKRSLKTKTWGKGFIGAGKTAKHTDAVRDTHDYYVHGVVK